MALLYSDQTRAGLRSPSFNLPGVDGRTYSLSDFKSSKVLAILFICNHCPYVKAIEERIIALQRHFQHKSVQLVGICSNDFLHYPDDAPANLKKRWEEKNYGFPYLVDETQEVAKTYGAVCTPDIFVYDEKRLLAYHGRLDDNWKEPDQVKIQDLKSAIESLLDGKKPSPPFHPSMGCSIKWKKSS